MLDAVVQEKFELVPGRLGAHFEIERSDPGAEVRGEPERAGLIIADGAGAGGKTAKRDDVALNHPRFAARKGVGQGVESAAFEVIREGAGPEPRIDGHVGSDDDGERIIDRGS